MMEGERKEHKETRQTSLVGPKFRPKMDFWGVQDDANKRHADVNRHTADISDDRPNDQENVLEGC
jgi:hypothetical protein